MFDWSGVYFRDVVHAPPSLVLLGYTTFMVSMASGRFLADRLQDAEHPAQALWAYEQTRLPMTAEIVRSNRRGGPEGVIDAVEERAPDGFTNIDDVLSFEDRKAIVRGYASKAGFSREQVNKAA